MPVSLILILVNGAALCPFAVPVLPVEKLAAFSRRMGITPPAGEQKEMGVLPQHFADQFGWEEMTETVARVYRGLPESEQKVCGIYTQNYGEAAAIDVLGRKYGLPRAISGHNNYWLWGPVAGRGEVLIIVGGKAEDHLKAYTEVVEVARHVSDYAMPYESNLPIYICRRPKVGLGEIWPQVRHYI